MTEGQIVEKLLWPVMPRSRKNSDQWQAKISSLTLIAFFVTFGATAKWRKKRLKYLICLPPRFPLCYAEAAMKAKDCNRPHKAHRCRSPKVTPARLRTWCGTPAGKPWSG